ncbi:MAG: DUF262 domain-containing protein [Ekhidna sp.]|nr:DUF262 domain-containing protein [Ekhidna sp.]MBC6409717.1 DUF262 domain-containing protein [Ekhidna sp.]
MDNNHSEHIEQEDLGMVMKKPFDPNNIDVQMQPTPISLMMQRIEYGEINLETAFQRKEGLWSDGQQSRLIESILIRFPLPVFYFDGSDTSFWLVIDGLQRLTSLKRFILDKTLTLTDLEFLRHLHGKSWDNLDRHMQRQINESILQCYILQRGDEDVKFNLFKRINTGGLSLTSQEIRHAMHQDVASFLKELAESNEFTKATRSKVSPDRMLDRDFVNRFLAFYLFNHETDYTYEDDLDTFMNQTLDKVSTLSESEKNDIKQRFKAAMTTARTIFGDAAFCKQQNHKRINKALFEVIAVSFARLNESQRSILVRKKALLKQLFYEAIPDDFGNSLTSNTGGKSNIARRHRTFGSIVNQVLNS